MWKSGTLKSGRWTHIPWHNVTYNWEGKIFENPSRYGINKGRVSKLHVWQDVEGVPVDVYCYDREPGLDILPPGILDRILEEITSD